MTARGLSVLSIALLLSIVSSRSVSQPAALSRYEAGRDLIRPAALESSPDSIPLTPGKKSAGLAIIYSLIVPGMGELYADGFSSGKYFLAAEALLWITYFGFEGYGIGMRDDSRTFAAVHAGVTTTGKDDQFFVDIGNFANVDDYNAKRLLDREIERVYDPAAGYGWRWDANDNRELYKDRRLSAENALNNRKFIGAAILINHLVSAINAARAAIAYNRALEQGTSSIDVRARILGGMESPHGVMLTFSRPF